MTNALPEGMTETPQLYGDLNELYFYGCITEN